jgi:hypothetical protein
MQITEDLTRTRKEYKRSYFDEDNGKFDNKIMKKKII